MVLRWRAIRSIYQQLWQTKLQETLREDEDNHIMETQNFLLHLVLFGPSALSSPLFPASGAWHITENAFLIPSVQSPSWRMWMLR